MKLITYQSGYILSRPWKPRAVFMFTLKTERVFWDVLIVLLQLCALWVCVCADKGISLDVFCYVDIFVFAFFWRK